MALEDALIESTGGDFQLTVIAVLLMFILGLCGYIVRWVMTTITQQMKEDREAMCDRMTQLINTFENVFKAHDDQAKKILETDSRIETKLDSRPCAMK